MMRALRPLIAVLAALSFLGGAALEPYGLHGCDHHADGHGASHGAGQMEEMGSSSAAPEAHAPESSESEDHGGPCTCVGECGVSGSATVPVAPTTMVAKVQARITDRSALDNETDPALAPLPYRLPWSNAPPARI